VHRAGRRTDGRAHGAFHRRHPDTGLAGILPGLLEKALQRGELPEDANIDLLRLAVGSVFFGVPLQVGAAYFDAVADLQRRQLQPI
tara:strand:- start:2 stop:259 length:258 start_codon:yes stop_codon:yes gene_type:complete